MDVPTYQYLTLSVDKSRKVTAGGGPDSRKVGDWMEDQITQYGQNGWDLAALSGDGDGGHLLIFKRQVGTKTVGGNPAASKPAGA